MNAIRVLVYKSFVTFLRNPVAVVLTFVVPISMIYIFGWVFGLHRKDSGPSGIRLAVVDESGDATGQKLVAALKAEKSFQVITQFNNPDKTKRPLTEADLRPLIENRAFRFAVVIPKRDRLAFGIRLKFLSNPLNEIEAQTVNGLLQKTIFSRVPELLGQSLQGMAREQLGPERLGMFNEGMANVISRAFGGDPAAIRQSIEQGDFGLSGLSSSTAADKQDGENKNAAADFFSRIVNIEKEQVVGKKVKSPEATRVVGGWAIMFLMFALNGAATSLLDEHQ